ncbi:unnamed protein product, partial [Prorocentrum cordatum]
ARPACDERARAGAGASLPPSARQWRRGRSRGREEEEEHKEDEERWNRAARAPGVGPRGCLCSRRQPALPCGPPRNHYGDGDEPGKLHDSADCGQSAPQLPLVGGACPPPTSTLDAQPSRDDERGMHMHCAPILARPILSPGSVHTPSCLAQESTCTDPGPRMDLGRIGACA